MRKLWFAHDNAEVDIEKDFNALNCQDDRNGGVLTDFEFPFALFN